MHTSMMRTKLDYKSEKYVFVGYDARAKGYKLYNPINGKIVISRDVVFDEESSWDWSNTQEDYNFFPIIDEESEENITPPTSP